MNNSFFGKNCKLSYGYTLIELLIGISVVGIIFSVGFVNFRDFSRRQALIGTVREISGELRLAQERALSGQKPDDINCNPPNTLAGYAFTVTSPNSYTVAASCSGGLVEIKNVQLVPTVTISTPNPNPILFKVLGEGTNIPSGTTATLILARADLESSIEIMIETGGEIN